jgi:hypothetical protein
MYALLKDEGFLQDISYFFEHRRDADIAAGWVINTQETMQNSYAESLAESSPDYMSFLQFLGEKMCRADFEKYERYKRGGMIVFATLTGASEFSAPSLTCVLHNDGNMYFIASPGQLFEFYNHWHKSFRPNGKNIFTPSSFMQKLNGVLDRELKGGKLVGKKQTGFGLASAS